MQQDDGSMARKKLDPKQKRKTLEQEQEKCVKEFNRTLAQIVKVTYNKNKLDNDIIEMKAQLEIGLKEVPQDIFERAGKYVWKYRELIAAGNSDEFLKKDYTEDVIDGIKEENDGTADESEVQKIMAFIKTIKKTSRAFNTTEKSDIMKKFQDMLKNYATYEDCRRQLKKIASQ